MSGVPLHTAADVPQYWHVVEVVETVTRRARVEFVSPGLSTDAARAYAVGAAEALDAWTDAETEYKVVSLARGARAETKATDYQ